MITKYIILGAGLAGLSTAYHLKEKGCDDWLILEREDGVGGLCRSPRYNGGYTFDHSIHILYSSDKYATELIWRLLDGNMIVQERESWVYSYGVYTPYPWQANTYGLPVEIVKECIMGVIKSTYERGHKPAPLNFEEWCYAIFGEGFAKHFMIPYNLKLWAIDLKLMTDAWIRDRVMTPSLSEVIDGALHIPKREFGPNSVFWYPERGGIESLPKSFLPHLDQYKISLNTEVMRVLWKERKVLTTDGREWRYDKLITSLPLPVIMEYLEPGVYPGLMEASGRLEHNTVYAINIAVKREDISPYHWVYFPEEKYLLHRISFPKNLSHSMAPDGWSSITVEVSTSRYRSVPVGDRLVEQVIADLKSAHVIMDKDVIEVKSVLILNPAYVIYNHTHRNNVNELHQFLKEAGIFPCGRFGEWEYLNMDHSILSGKRIVEKILTE